MANQTANIDAPYISSAQNQPEVVANSAFDAFDGALGSLLTTAMSDANYTLNTSASPDEVTNYLAYLFTGALTGDRNIIIPVDPLNGGFNHKLFAVWNGTSGGHNLVLKTSTGTGVTIAPSPSAYILCYCDGTNVVAVGSTGGGSGTVTHTGSLTAHAVVLGNGTADIKALGSLGTATTVLHGNASGDPSFGSIVEADLSLSDVTTANATTGQHGFLKKLSGDATQFMNGAGNWAVPAGGGGGGGGANSGTYATTIGDGVTLVYSVTHSLDTDDVVVEVHDISTGEMEIVDVAVVDVNTVSVTFASAPSSNSKRVVVVAAGVATTLASLGDVEILCPTDGQELVYNSMTGKWENQSADDYLAELLDVLIASPTDGQVLTYDSMSGLWENKTPSGGGGGIPAGTPLCVGAVGSSTNSAWNNYTFQLKLHGCQLVHLPAAFKIAIEAIGGTGISLNAAWIMATTKYDTTALSGGGYAPVQITWAGGNASYATPFSGASATDPFKLYSDSITGMTFDADHDYYIFIYLDTDGGGFNAALGTWGSADSGPSPFQQGHGGGNNIPATGGGGSVSVSGGFGYAQLVFISDLVAG